VFEQQQARFGLLRQKIKANSQQLFLPFLLIEFKGDSSSGDGSLWVGTNQCQGGSATCVNLTERLNNQLRKYRIDSIESAILSIAMSGTQARLYISWYDYAYRMQTVKNFLVSNPEDNLLFRRYVLNITDWDKNERLQQIQNAMARLPRSMGPIKKDDEDQGGSGDNEGEEHDDVDEGEEHGGADEFHDAQ
jgi:hypothetical protein